MSFFVFDRTGCRLVKYMPPEQAVCERFTIVQNDKFCGSERRKKRLFHRKSEKIHKIYVIIYSNSNKISSNQFQKLEMRSIFLYKLHTKSLK